MNKALVERYFQRYPKLEIFICAGTVSLKMAREILGIDRHEMYDAFLDLVEAQAVYGSGSNCFRATKELRDFVAERRKSSEAGEAES